MQKFAILTSALAALAVAAFLLRNTAAVAWQDDAATEAAGDEPAAAAEDASQTLPPIDPAVAAEAVSLLEQARDRLYAYHAVEAQLIERASFGGNRFKAEGRYLAGPFPQLRLEYVVRVGESEGLITEVCDGQILRVSKQIRPIDAEGTAADATVHQVTRIDVRQIIQASDGAASPDAIVHAELGIGGLPALLASLQRTMEFEALQEQDYQGKAYFVLQGRWNEEFLEKLAADPNLASRLAQFSQYIPHRVRVFLDRETLFPHRILYLQQATSEPVTYRQMMTLEFTNVVLNGTLDPSEFRYAPPEGVAEIDETNLYIELIESFRAAEAAAEAAEAGASTAGAGTDPEQQSQ